MNLVIYIDFYESSFRAMLLLICHTDLIHLIQLVLTFLAYLYTFFLQ